MCENHAVDEPFWMRRFMLWSYGRWVDDTLDLYLFLGNMGRKPLIGGAVRYFAARYGEYLHGGRAATVDEACEVLAEARQITLMDCACRVKSGNCEKPLRTCIGINTGAEVLGGLRKEKQISEAEAKEIIFNSYKHGLIRSVTHCVSPNTYVICNCCTCCCVPFRLRSVYGIRTAMDNGARIAVLDRSKCLACGECADFCPGQAVDPDGGGVDGEKCLGCGLCLDSCPAGALEMSDRHGYTALNKPGFPKRVLMYAAFFGVIFPVALIYKIFKT
ncbi:MAG: hypothetical protein CVU89_05825 [Firmicutes bacterium HGW-Firmicutes-14]|nr:MAG: hypothetical protein CVU89_05825 [Firmicutes bacterium HGW-Firmicutes-14]